MNDKINSHICTVCGASHDAESLSLFKIECRFCGFKRLIPSSNLRTKIPCRDINHSHFKLFMTYSKSKIIYYEGIKTPETLLNTVFIPYTIDQKIIDSIWSDFTLPFTTDIQSYFTSRYSSLNKEGLIYISLPVSRFYKNPKPLDHQLNVFKSKNIMFLLEQNGFQMVWRQSRFLSKLCLIARKI
jgi:DNA-directed RNA polymerase subunit RPC12/RpoP